MPTKLQLLSELAEETAKRVTSSLENWTGFLNTVGRLYKYPYHEQLMIYAQRPDATACIEQNRGNGYIWHTTGSGKTLTSFKASTLLKDNPEIEKCLFVVDRKDLDRQTRLEFNKFQEGCVEENTNTENLVKRLTSDDYKDKVIVLLYKNWVLH